MRIFFSFSLHFIYAKKQKIEKFFNIKKINKLKLYFKKEHNKCSKRLINLINNKEQFNNLISQAKNDICWRLYDGKINLNILKKCILDAKS